MPSVTPRVRDILAGRTGEEMALNDAYLNPQMGRIVRTLGFDRTWVRGEGAHLIDADGNRYLDLLCGYGVFAIGRNHPDAIAAVRGRDGGPHSEPPPARGDTAERACSPSSCSRAPPVGRGDGAREHRHRGGRGGDQDRPCRDRPPAHPLRRARLPRPHARLALAQRQRGVPRGLRAAAARLSTRSRSATLERSSASSRRERRRRVHRRAGPGQGRQPAARRLPRRPPSGSAATPARCSCATRCRPGSAAPDASSRSSTGGWSRT